MDPVTVQIPDITVFGVIPAASAGFRDILCPGGILGLFLFCVFLVMTSHYRKFTILGAYFLIMAAVTHIGLGLGLMDPFANSGFFNTTLDVGYFILVVGMLFFAVAISRDWLVCKVRKDQARLFIRFPFLEGPASSGIGESSAQVSGESPRFLGRFINKHLLFLLGASILGAGMAVLRAGWPPDAYVSMLAYQMITGNNILACKILAVFYGFGYISFFLVIWLGAYLIRRNLPYSDFFRRSLGGVQVVCAALFWGFGLAFLSYYRN